MKRYIAFAVFALIAAYAPDWGRYYVELFQRESASSSVSLVSNQQNDRITYSLPNVSGYREKRLSLGVVWPLPEMSCDGKRFSVPGAAIASDKNSVFTLSIPPESDCRVVNFEFQKTPGYFLFGRIGGRPFVGSVETVTAYKRIVDFFFGDIRLLLLVIVLVHLLFLNLSVSKLSSSEELGPIERYTLPWGLFLLCSAGVFEMLIPWAPIRSQIPKLNSYLSAIAHLGPGIDYVWRRYRKKTPSILMVSVVLAVLLFFPDRMLGFVSIGLPVALLTLLATIGADHVGAYFFYSVLLAINFIKLAGGFGIDPSYLPHFHVVSIYIGMVICDNLIKQVRSVASITSFISWASAGLAEIKTKEDLSILLRMGLETIDAKKVDLVVSDNGVCQIISVWRESGNTFSTEMQNCSNLPPFFAAVLTSNETSILLDAKSERAINMRKSPASSDVGFISVAPIKLGGAAMAAVAFEGLSEIIDPREKVFHRKIFELFVTHLESAIKAVCDNEISKNNHTLVEIVQFLSEVPPSLNENEVIERTLNDLFKELQCTGVYFAYSDEELKFSPAIMIGLKEQNRSIASGLHVQVVDANEHGPFVLAVKNKRPVFVNQISLIEAVLRGRTSSYLNACSTRSMALVPILQNGSDESGVPFVRSVLMVQSELDNFFNTAIQNLLSQYAGVLERYLHLKVAEDERNTHQAALHEFVPLKVSQLLLSGKSTRISSFGFFGCIDLVGSSVLLKANGDDWFRKVVNKLSEELRGYCPNVQLASMNWDAFYFSSSSIDELIGLYAVCANRLSVVEDLNGSIQHLRFRLCITYGDTSQDFCEANGFKRWTVVGESMAAVCKFEQAVKSLGEGVFVDRLAYVACAVQEKGAFVELESHEGVYAPRETVVQAA